MLIEGLKFGMILQLAIGPMCLMVFETAGSKGLLSAFILVSAIALADAIYILLAGAGVSALLNKKGFKIAFKITGSIVLALFGLNIVLSVFGMSLLPGISLFSGYSGANTFMQGLILTASNPLTIVFWGSVFSAKAAEKDMNKRDLIIFGCGCVMATLLFLGFVAIIGAVISNFLPMSVLKALNFGVGLFIIGFAVKLIIKK